jgi:hypothetical protein
MSEYTRSPARQRELAATLEEQTHIYVESHPSTFANTNLVSVDFAQDWRFFEGKADRPALGEADPLLLVAAYLH